MASRLLWRRSATAAGIYGSTALGILGAVVVLRVLGPTDAGRFSLAVGMAAFFQLLLELTSDEALVKFGFRYAAQQNWGRFHRLVRLTFSWELGASLLAGGIVAILAPFADSLFHSHGLQTPTLIAAFLPPLQAVESMGAAALILRSRYDIRAGFQSFSMGLRLVAIVVGTQIGVTETVVAVVAAQVVTTASIVGAGLAALRRFPAAAPEPLGVTGAPCFPSCSSRRSGPGSSPCAGGSPRSPSASSATRPTSASSAARRLRCSASPRSALRCG